MKKRGKIRRIMLTINILSVMIPIMIVGLIAQNKAENVTGNNLQLSSVQILQEVNKGFSKEMGIRTQQLIAVSKNSNIKELSNVDGNHELAISNTQELFKNIKATIDGSLNVYFGGEYGEIVGITKVKSINDFNYKEREWYIRAKEADGQAIFTMPSEDKETGKQVMTIAVAAKDDSGTFLGVIALDINCDFMNEYVGNITLKNTGYVMIVNNDGTIIINNDKNTAESFSELPFWSKVQNEENGKYEWKSNGGMMFVSQMTNHDTGWKIIGLVNEGETLDDVSGIKSSIFIVSVICFIISCFVGIGMTIYIVKQIRKINKSIGKVSNGDFTEKIDINSNNEFGELGENFNKMIDNISELIDNVEKTANNLFTDVTNMSNMSEETRSSVSDVTKTIGNVAHGASDQAHSVKNGTKKMEELDNKINEVRNGADTIKILSNNTAEFSKDGLTILEELIDKSEQTKINSVKSIEIVNDMGESIEKINYISNLISDITEQTNLLALNASIEAARAGEAGKGFAVVAEEIRKLAEESKKSTDEIRNIATEINNKAISAKNAMEESSNILNKQDDAVNKTREIFNKIAESIEPLTETIKNINDLSIQMNEDKDDVKNEMENILVSSEDTAAISEEVAASAEEVNTAMHEFAKYTNHIKETADKLQQQINKFSL